MSALCPYCATETAEQWAEVERALSSPSEVKVGYSDAEYEAKDAFYRRLVRHVIEPSPDPTHSRDERIVAAWAVLARALKEGGGSVTFMASRDLGRASTRAIAEAAQPSLALFGPVLRELGWVQ